MWRHPKYYKELRKRNKPAGTGGALCVDPEAGSDQAIRLRESETSTGDRSPGPGLKLQAREDSTANSTRGRVAEPQASSDKQQADKAQATETQASSSKR